MFISVLYLDSRTAAASQALGQLIWTVFQSILRVKQIMHDDSFYSTKAELDFYCNLRNCRRGKFWQGVEKIGNQWHSAVGGQWLRSHPNSPSDVMLFVALMCCV